MNPIRLRFSRQIEAIPKDLTPVLTRNVCERASEAIRFLPLRFCMTMEQEEKKRIDSLFRKKEEIESDRANISVRALGCGYKTLFRSYEIKVLSAKRSENNLQFTFSKLLDSINTE